VVELIAIVPAVFNVVILLCLRRGLGMRACSIFGVDVYRRIAVGRIGKVVVIVRHLCARRNPVAQVRRALGAHLGTVCVSEVHVVVFNALCPNATESDKRKRCQQKSFYFHSRSWFCVFLIKRKSVKKYSIKLQKLTCIRRINLYLSLYSHKTAKIIPYMGKEIPTRQEDYSLWYNELVKRADLAEHSDVRGCMVIKPYGYSIWEKMQQALDKMFKDTGHTNAYFPLFVPKSLFEAEEQNAEGFAKECAIV